MSANEIHRDAGSKPAPCGIAEQPNSSVVRRASSPVPLPAAPQGLSLRSNFAWTLSGNIVYAACQWGMIVALAKLGNTVMVGQFSLGLAIATPVLMFSNLHLRAVQATDATRTYRFSEYLQLRTMMTAAGMAAIACIAWFGGYGVPTTLVILAVALAKAVEALSDIHYGLFQLNDRLDHTGRSMMLRGAAALIALSVTMYLTRSVFWACVWMAIAWLGALLFFDMRYGRRLLHYSERQNQSAAAPSVSRRWKLVALALPLGAVTTLTSINLNMPRYFIQAHMGEHELGIFSAMAYATVAMTLISDSLGHCAIPRMSRLYAAGQYTEFRGLLLKLLIAAGAIGIAGLFVAQAAGARLLTIVYSKEYAAYASVFVVLMLATAMHFVASMLTCGITSARQFAVQVPLFLAAVGANAWACARWVPSAGLAGGAMGMVAGAGARLVLAAIVVAYLLLRPTGGVIGRLGGWELSL